MQIATAEMMLPEQVDVHVGISAVESALVPILDDVANRIADQRRIKLAGRIRDRRYAIVVGSGNCSVVVDTIGSRERQPIGKLARISPDVIFTALTDDLRSLIGPSPRFAVDTTVVSPSQFVHDVEAVQYTLLPGVEVGEL